MRSGLLRHRVVVQSPNNTRDTTGADVRGWTTEATVYASVDPIRGREFFEAQKFVGEVTHRIRLRYHASLASMKPDWRVTFGSQTFGIVSVLRPRSIKRDLEILAKELPLGEPV